MTRSLLARPRRRARRRAAPAPPRRPARPAHRRRRARSRTSRRSRATLRMPGYRGRIGIETRGQSSQQCSRRSRSRSSCATPGRGPQGAAARHARRRRLGALRALQRQDADAQRRRLRDRALDRPLRRAHPLRAAAAQRPPPGRLRADGEARARRRPRRRARRCSSSPSRSRRARRRRRSARRSSGARSSGRTPSAATSRARARERARRARSAPPSARCTGRAAGARHLDEASAVDFALINELFKNQDGFHASTYMALRDDGKLHLGPVWDFDISMGNSDYGPSRRLARLDARAARLGRAALPRRAASRARWRARWRELRRDGLRRDVLADRRPQRGASCAARSRPTSAAGPCSTGGSGRTRSRAAATGRDAVPARAG